MNYERKERDVDFVAANGLYNYWSDDDGKTYRETCPGFLKVESYYVDTNDKEHHLNYEFRAASVDAGLIMEAEGINYLGTYGDARWQESDLPT